MFRRFLSTTRFSYSTTNTSNLTTKYNILQEQYPDSFVFYQVGDFFEVYGKKVEEASQLLNLCIARADSDRKSVGFPFDSLDKYLHRLVGLGKAAVVCEQVKDSKEKIHRLVSRIVTPGTVLGDGILAEGHNNYLVSVNTSASTMAAGVAWADVSTGYCRISNCRLSDLDNFLKRLSPTELLLDPKGFQTRKIGWAGCRIKALEEKDFDMATFHAKAESFYQPHQQQQFAKNFSPLELGAASALLSYIASNYPLKLPRLEPPIRWDAASKLALDMASYKSLEMDTLKTCLNRTITPFGKRLFERRLGNPLCNIDQIEKRLEKVDLFVNNPTLLKNLRDKFSGIFDLERIVKRLETHSENSLRDFTQTPKELRRLASSLEKWSELKNDIFKNDRIKELFFSNDASIMNSDWSERIAKEINSAVGEVSTTKNGVILANYDQDLDTQRNSGDLTEEELKSQYKKALGSKHFKIVTIPKHGLVIECTKSKKLSDRVEGLEIVSSTAKYVRYQDHTLKTASMVRIVDENKTRLLEMKVLNSLVEKIVESGSSEILQMARILSELDVAAAVAQLALDCQYCRPVIDSSSSCFRIVEGRHPMVETALTDRCQNFQPNDCHFQDRFWLITGPNMGGKSTFLRQNAIIAIMAHAGMYVPAREAHMGYLDSIFTRIGASDDLSQDKSTFMVEMSETANILLNSGKRSLVIIDEIGRGTSHVDGFSVAFAVAHHLFQVNKSLCLFATHYHDLVSAMAKLPIELYCTEIITNGDDILFDHRIRPGSVSESKGLEIAALAGVPKSVIQKARSFKSKIEPVPKRKQTKKKAAAE